MKLLLFIFFILIKHILNIESLYQILPFTSIKVNNDEIFFTLDNSRTDWKKLLSIDNTGSDAIIKYSKEHYGLDKCDYEIECYIYNIIANFGEVYYKLQSRYLPEKISLEHISGTERQNGIDVESTKEKYEINEKYLIDNITKSKKILNNNNNGLLKGLNKIKKGIKKFLINDLLSSNTDEDYNKNLRSDINYIKDEILSLSKKENLIEKVLLL